MLQRSYQFSRLGGECPASWHASVGVPSLSGLARLGLLLLIGDPFGVNGLVLSVGIGAEKQEEGKR